MQPFIIKCFQLDSPKEQLKNILIFKEKDKFKEFYEILKTKWK